MYFHPTNKIWVDNWNSSVKGEKTHWSKQKIMLIKIPIEANYKDVCLQNASKSHSYRLKIW